MQILEDVSDWNDTSVLRTQCSAKNSNSTTSYEHTMDKELTTGSLPIGVLYPGNFLQKKLTNFTANFYTTTNRTVQNKQHHAQY